MAIEETIQAINMPGFTRKSCHSKRGIGSIAMQKIAFRIKGIGRNCILDGKRRHRAVNVRVARTRQECLAKNGAAGEI
ncbi:MAG: hypothetical protein CMO06_01160 [Thalassospira sp.]|nr:hypothetical protein [Thalassospira sp.]